MTRSKADHIPLQHTKTPRKVAAYCRGSSLRISHAMEPVHRQAGSETTLCEAKQSRYDALRRMARQDGRGLGVDPKNQSNFGHSVLSVGGGSTAGGESNIAPLWGISPSGGRRRCHEGNGG